MTHRFFCLLLIGLSSCNFFKIKRDASDESGQVRVARAGDNFLYANEVKEMGPFKGKADSTARVNAFIDTWVRKQLFSQQAAKEVDVDEGSMRRRLAEYRNSLVNFQYQKNYINQNLNTEITEKEISDYYKAHSDNFMLRQNIVKGSFIQVPVNSPKTGRLKDFLLSTKEKDVEELKAYCVRYSETYHLGTEWVEFNKLVGNSPMKNIPDKIDFLRSHPYYETTDAKFIYILRVAEYRISNSPMPIEFAHDEIENIILNKRKVELIKKLEEDIYASAVKKNEIEIFNQ